MQHEGAWQDSVTFVGVLNAWIRIVALQEGMYIIGQIIQSGYKYEVFVWTSLVDMYMQMWEHNQLISLFVYLLSVHYPIGLVYESMQYYVLTIKLHAFCYTCMLDLLGHAGHP